MTYTHISQTERYQIQALMKAGQTQIENARILGRHKSTISREVARGSGRRGYRPRQTQNLSEGRSQSSRNTSTLMNKSCFKCGSCSVCSGVPSRLPASCLSATRRFTKRFTQTKRWAVIYGAPYAARNKGANGMPVVVIDEAKSLIGAPLLFDPNRLSDEATLITGKATPLLGQHTSTPSSRWLRDKAAMQ